MRSSPQFGFTLAAYEALQTLLPMPGEEKEPSVPHMGVASSTGGLPEQGGPLQYLRSKNALKIILDLDEDFGKVKVPGKEGWRALPAIMGGGKGSFA